MRTFVRSARSMLLLCLVLLGLSSCVDPYYYPGVARVGVGIGYYDTLPRNHRGPYYAYGNRYYYGGRWEPGRYHHAGRWHDGRYYHHGRYYYGGRFHAGIHTRF